MRLLDRSPVVLGIVVVAAAALLQAANFSGKLAGIFAAQDTRTVQAEFAGTQQLRVGNDVRIDGVNVGRVAAITRVAGGRRALVRMNVRRDAGPLYGDAGAVLRWKTALGAAFYVRLERGTPGQGDLGARTIPLSRTAGQVEVDDITSVFRRDATRGMQTMPRELSRALGDRQAPARALRTLDAVAPSVTRGVGALRGQRVDRDLRELVASSAATARALDTPDDALRAVVAGAAATVDTTAARQGDLRATIARSPAVLARTDRTVAALDHTLRLADPLIADLRGPAPQVATTLRALRPTVVRADALLRRAVPLLHALRPAVTALVDASRISLPLVREIAPSLGRLDKTILPYMAEVDPETQRSTTEMIGPTFTGLGSGAGGQQDVNGHFIRFPASSGSSPAYLPCQEYFGNPSAPKMVACKSLQDALNSYLTYNPFGGTPGSAPPPGDSKP